MLADLDYLAWIRRWLWLVVLGTLLGGSIAFAISEHTPPTYQSTATLLIDASAVPNALTYSDVLLSQQLTLTYSKIATKAPVLTQVIRDGRLPYSVEQLQAMVTAAPVLQTQLITITARTHDAQDAARIANLVATTFIAQQRDRLTKGEASNAISVVETSAVPPAPVSPRIRLNSFLGMFVGVLVAVGLISLVTYLDDTIKSHRDVEKALQLPVLGLIHRDANQAKLDVEDGHVVQARFSAEVFRIVRANLDFATAGYHSKVLLVTSTQKSEGKTTTAVKVAVALAETGKRVIVADADLRLPAIHKHFHLPNQRGLTNLLVHRTSIPEDFESYLQETPLANLFVLASGPMPPNPTELLQSDSMSQLLAALAGRADVIILDSPPVLAVADAMTLAPKTQGVIFVVESAKVRIGRIHEALGRLQRAGTPVIGVVLNKVNQGTEGYDYYSYRSYYNGYGRSMEKHRNGAVNDLDEVVAGQRTAPSGEQEPR